MAIAESRTFRKTFFGLARAHAPDVEKGNHQVGRQKSAPIALIACRDIFISSVVLDQERADFHSSPVCNDAGTGEVQTCDNPLRRETLLNAKEGFLETGTIYQKLTDVMHDVFDDDSIVLAPELTADQVDGWDSLAHIRLMLAVEKAFGIRIAAAEVGKLKNTGDLVALIRAKAP